MVLALFASRYFHENFSADRKACIEGNDFPQMIRLSQFVKCLNRLDPAFWGDFLRYCCDQGPRRGLRSDFLVDSCPIRACHTL